MASSLCAFLSLGRVSIVNNNSLEIECIDSVCFLVLYFSSIFEVQETQVSIRFHPTIFVVVHCNETKYTCVVPPTPTVSRNHI